MEKEFYRRGFHQLRQDLQRDPNLLNLVLVEYIGLGHECENLRVLARTQQPVNIPITSGTTTTDQLREMLENLMQEITARRSSNGVKLTLNYNGDNITVAPVNTSVDIQMQMATQELQEATRRIEAERQAHQATTRRLEEERQTHQATTRRLDEERHAHHATNRRLTQEQQDHHATKQELQRLRTQKVPARAELPKEQPV